MKKKCRPYLGYEMTPRLQGDIASLIGFTTLPVGISKRQIKTEETLWSLIKKIFDYSPPESLSFPEKIRARQSAYI